MSTDEGGNKSYTIKQVANLTGLSEHTLRFYETIGIIDRIKRDLSSRHRSYSEQDLNKIDSLACLSATGMSIKNMREYMTNSRNGTATAQDQIALLENQEEHLASEAEYLKVRQQYVKLKIKYWQAIEKQDEGLAQDIGDRARALSRGLIAPVKPKYKS